MRARMHAMAGLKATAAIVSIALVSATIFPAGCTSCDRGARVPFKRGTDTMNGTRDAQQRADSAPSTASRPPDVPFEPRRGQRLQEGTRELDIDGAKLELADGAFRAALALDVDKDGDKDALVLATDAEGVPTLRFAKRSESGLEELGQLGADNPGMARCQLLSGEIRTIAPIYAVARLELTCGGEPALAGKTAPMSSETKDQQPAETHFWVVALQEAPRLIGQFAALPPAPELAPGTVELELDAEDLDQDGHSDIIMRLTYGFPEGSESERLTLHWLNRPGGLARDRSQPEARLLELANRARRVSKRDPESGLAMVERVRLLHAALCAERGAARLRIGARNGLNCGRSAAAGRAEAVACQALVAKGNAVAAIQAAAELERKAYEVTSRDRRLVQEALDSIPEVTGLTWREGPRHRFAARPDVRLSAVAFVDENTLLLRGAVPMTYDLERRALAPAELAAGSATVVDPSGRLAVVGIGRACHGYRLRIASASQVVASLAMGPAVAEPLIADPCPHWGSTCSDPGAEPRGDIGTFQVLGWTESGIVLARGEQLQVVTLDQQARDRGVARVLKPGQAPPGPLPAGAIARDGRFFAVITPLGIAVKRMFPSFKTALLRLEKGWSHGEVSDVAVSPSGRRVAVARKGRVYIAM